RRSFIIFMNKSPSPNNFNFIVYYVMVSVAYAYPRTVHPVLTRDRNVWHWSLHVSHNLGFQVKEYFQYIDLLPCPEILAANGGHGLVRHYSLRLPRLGCRWAGAGWSRNERGHNGSWYSARSKLPDYKPHPFDAPPAWQYLA